eukprot:7545641-Alexandrium_andersonii.AAC.1
MSASLVGSEMCIRDRCRTCCLSLTLCSAGRAGDALVADAAGLPRWLHSGTSGWTAGARPAALRGERAPAW